MGEPLMEALLDFKVFFTNRQYAVQFGRIDIESMDWFPGGISNENMNKWAAELLAGPPLLPVAADRASAGIVPEPSNNASATLPPLGELKAIQGNECGVRVHGLRVLQAQQAGRQQNENATDGGGSSGGGWSEH